jgi:hypothetical protein
MDESGHMGGANSTCGNWDYERQAMSSWVHDSTRKATSWSPQTQVIIFNPKLAFGYYLHPRHELESYLRESEKIHKEKLRARKEKKMARVKPLLTLTLMFLLK